MCRLRDLFNHLIAALFLMHSQSGLLPILCHPINQHKEIA